MSHISETSTKYRNLEDLAAAVAACGGEFLWNEREHAWWGSFVGDSPGIAGRDASTYGKCLHAIKVKGTNPQSGHGLNNDWSIGVVAALDGDGYSLAYDSFGSAGRKLEEAFGSQLEKIAEEYGAAVAMRELALSGYTVVRQDAATLRQ